MENLLNSYPCLYPGNQGLIGSALDKVAANKKDLNRSERSDLLRSTYGNRDKAAAYAATRKEVINIAVLVDLIASEVFELVALAKNETILIQTKTNQEFQVKTINQRGGYVRDEWAIPDAPNHYQLYEVSTSEVAFPIECIQQGDIQASNDVNRDLDFSYKNNIDVDVLTLWFSIFGAFPSGVYDAHSRIVAANIPTTNIVDASAQGALNIVAIKALLTHMLLAGRTIRTAYISPQDMPDIWDWTTVVAGYNDSGVEPKDVISLQKHQEIWESGRINSIFGYPIRWKLVNFLDTGSIYFTTQYPSGTLYYKPDYETIVHYTQDEAEKILKLAHSEAVKMKGVIKPLIPAPYYLNSVRLDIA